MSNIIPSGKDATTGEKKVVGDADSLVSESGIPLIRPNQAAWGPQFTTLSPDTLTVLNLTDSSPVYHIISHYVRNPTASFTTSFNTAGTQAYFGAVRLPAITAATPFFHITHEGANTESSNSNNLLTIFNTDYLSLGSLQSGVSAWCVHNGTSWTICRTGGSGHTTGETSLIPICYAGTVASGLLRTLSLSGDHTATTYTTDQQSEEQVHTYENSTNRRLKYVTIIRSVSTSASAVIVGLSVDVRIQMLVGQDTLTYACDIPLTSIIPVYVLEGASSDYKVILWVEHDNVPYGLSCAQYGATTSTTANRYLRANGSSSSVASGTITTAFKHSFLGTLGGVSQYMSLTGISLNHDSNSIQFDIYVNGAFATTVNSDGNFYSFTPFSINQNAEVALLRVTAGASGERTTAILYGEASGSGAEYTHRGAKVVFGGDAATGNTLGFFMPPDRVPTAATPGSASLLESAFIVPYDCVLIGTKSLQELAVSTTYQIYVNRTLAYPVITPASNISVQDYGYLNVKAGDVVQVVWVANDPGDNFLYMRFE